MKKPMLDLVTQYKFYLLSYVDHIFFSLFKRIGSLRMEDDSGLEFTFASLAILQKKFNSLIDYKFVVSNFLNFEDYGFWYLYLDFHVWNQCQLCYLMDDELRLFNYILIMMDLEDKYNYWLVLSWVVSFDSMVMLCPEFGA